MADLDPPKIPYQAEVVGTDRILTQPWLKYFQAWASKIVSGVVQLVSGTAGRILVTGSPTNPIINIDPAYVASAAQGGTGQSSYLLGDTLYASGPSALSKLPGVIPNTRYFLGQAGSGSASAAPAWLPSTYFNVRDPLYGATGDGVTDDTAAFNLALAAANGNGRLFIPAGTYLVNIRLDGNVPVRGAGIRSTVLKPFVAASPCVQMYSTGGDGNLGNRLSDLSIYAHKVLGVYTKTGIGLECGTSAGLSGPSNGTIETVDIQGFQTNWLIKSGIAMNFRQIWSSGGVYGIDFNSEGNTTTLAFDGVRVATCDYGIRMRSGLICSFRNVVSESSKYHNLILETYVTNGPSKLWFENCWFEDITGLSGTRSGILFDMEPSISATKPMDIYFNRCIISTPVGIADLIAERAQGVIFDTCVFSATADKYTSTKFVYSTGDDSVRIKLINCGTIQAIPTPALYASFPALTRTSGGVFGYFYEFSGKNGKRYTNYEYVSLAIDVENYQVAYLQTLSVDTTLNNRAVITLIGGENGQFIDVIKPSALFTLTIVNNGTGTTGYEPIFTRSGQNILLTGNTSMRLAFMNGSWYETGSNPTFIGTDFSITGALKVTKDSSALVPTIQAEGVVPRYGLKYTGAPANQALWERSIGNNAMVDRTRSDDGLTVHDFALYPRTNGLRCEAIQYDTRIEFKKGANIVVANDATLGTDGNYFVFTLGAVTELWRILPTLWQAGSVVFLELPAGVTVRHNIAAGGGYVPIYLAGLVDWVVGVNGGILPLIYNGTFFKQVASRIDYAVGSTGTGNQVFSTSPTIATSLTASYATANTAAAWDGSKNLVSVAPVGSGSPIYGSSGSFSFAITGCTTAPTATAYYSVLGTVVTLLIPQLAATSNTTALTFTGLPAAIRPTNIQYFTVPNLQDNGAFATLKTDVSVTASGTVTFQIGDSPTGFTNAGLKGTGHQFSITYLLQ